MPLCESLATDQRIFHPNFQKELTAKRMGESNYDSPILHYLGKIHVRISPFVRLDLSRQGERDNQRVDDQ